MDSNDKIIASLLKDFQSGHSEYQIENFIIGSEVHPWHRYIQCLREISHRSENISEQREAVKEIAADVKTMSRRSFFRTKRFKTKFEFKKKRLFKLLSAVKETERELDCFVRLAVEIKKSFNGNLTEERKRFLESDAWRKKAEFMMTLDAFCLGGFSRQTMEFVYKLPKKIKSELIAGFNNGDKNKIMRNLIDG